jgi:hypothetical protein
MYIYNTHGSHALPEKERIQAKINQILSENEHWKQCQDGSYEMALSYAGIYELYEELRELENQ